jgi:hypothetical protein
MNHPKGPYVKRLVLRVALLGRSRIFRKEGLRGPEVIKGHALEENSETPVFSLSWFVK